MGKLNKGFNWPVSDKGFLSEDSGESPAPSTVHRWIGTLAGFVRTAKNALELISGKNPATSLCRDLAMLSVSPKKRLSLIRFSLIYGAR